MSILLPDKHTPVEESLLRHAFVLYNDIGASLPVARAWAVARELLPRMSFDRFVLILDVLFAIGAIELDGDLLTKRGVNAA